MLKEIGTGIAATNKAITELTASQEATKNELLRANDKLDGRMDVISNDMKHLSDMFEQRLDRLENEYPVIVHNQTIIKEDLHVQDKKLAKLEVTVSDVSKDIETINDNVDKITHKSGNALQKIAAMEETINITKAENFTKRINALEMDVAKIETSIETVEKLQKRIGAAENDISEALSNTKALSNLKDMVDSNRDRLAAQNAVVNFLTSKPVMAFIAVAFSAILFKYTNGSFL